MIGFIVYISATHDELFHVGRVVGLGEAAPVPDRSGMCEMTRSQCIMMIIRNKQAKFFPRGDTIESGVSRYSGMS